MSVSGSALATLLAVVFAGPLVWGGIYAFKWYRSRGTVKAAPPAAENTDEREKLGSVEYIIVLIGYSIGIGNVWRFPYLVGKHGGGAFVLAYLVCLVFCAIPLYYMEMILGQYTRRSPVECFKMIHPRWETMGYSQFAMAVVTLVYYNILIAYALVYIISSLNDPLPWSPAASNTTEVAVSTQSPAVRFWQAEVLNRYPETSDSTGWFVGQSLGPLQPHLVGALLAIWSITFITLAFGKQVLAKVTWVTVVLPIVLLVVLLIQAVSLPGAADGIVFYVGKFDAEQLLNPELWAVASGQILFSLGPGFGTAIAMSSYIDPKQDVYRACSIVAISNSTFSIIGGFAIFSILGNLAYRTGQTVAEVASVSGTGLAFISIAEGMLSFGNGSYAMAVLFFIVIFMLGLDSTFAWAQTVHSFIDDYFQARGKRVAGWKIMAAQCSLLFLLGLPFCTRLGSALLDVTDHFSVAYVLLLGNFVEIVMFHMDFTWTRFHRAVSSATVSAAWPKGRVLWPWYWLLCLRVTAPLLTLGLFLELLVNDLTNPYGGYPTEYLVYGWSLVVVLLLPMALILKNFRKGKSSLPALRDSTQPSVERLSGCSLVSSSVSASSSAPDVQKSSLMQSVNVHRKGLKAPELLPSELVEARDGQPATELTLKATPLAARGGTSPVAQAKEKLAVDEVEAV